MTVLDKEPLSIVEPLPISQLSSIITIPMCGYLIFPLLFGKKPKPFFPIIHPSKILTLFFIIVFLIITFDPIEQLSPIITLLSKIELCPIKQFLPILTFLPIKTYLPNLTFFLKEVLLISFT